MKRHAVLLLSLLIIVSAASSEERKGSYDYWQFDRNLIQYGQQANFLCNGLFTSHRTLEQVFAQELAYLEHPVGTAAGGDYVVDWEQKRVAIGGSTGTPTMRAAFREGIGCVILAPDQTLDDVDSLPILKMPAPSGDPATIPWPQGDLVEDPRSV
ncbi:MAG TPA: hypothetical protein VLK65_20185 [Vicinamibacteria bacterium]|nr:hypothetical protein [Vicinamibacteria bacterium]